MSLADEILMAGAMINRQGLGNHPGIEVKSSKQTVQDTITPYKICVLALIRLYLVSGIVGVGIHGLLHMC